ncbi:YhjD/YihY/BrkB family envelope integrity protein [Haloarcula salinisoli]|uniref:YihY/virulence factor BrkB family protein n=1 Tax=Haloarcula salinisoli TaxID=2487746 RepID=A0A8J7YLD3_9EURY|nr:YhjD/YihY/BrkB family envelope integrity protein [Halomicroarcula salinisoli]MBX0303308.1 YihY/virulence factor BrkB family protein [Halomicroarcula salinisoli]
MNDRVSRIEEVGRAVVHEARVEKITFMAGSIAYHAFLSILPLLLLVLTVLQRTENAAIRDSVVGILESVLTEQASVLIQQGLSDADASVSLLGLVFLVWGALRIFRGLDTAFSDIYETSEHNTFADQLADGSLMLVTVALALVGVSAVGNAVSLSLAGPLGTVLRALATTVGLFVVFYPMYYVFPDTDVTLLEVVPGTVFAAVGLTVAQVLFTEFRGGTAAGANLVASILLLLTWLYIIGLVVLLGAVVNAVLSNRSADVDIAPVIDGVDQHATPSDTSPQVVLADLDTLSESIDEADEVTVTVDGHSVTLDAPQAAIVERESGVFGLDDSVALTLRWWLDDE